MVVLALLYFREEKQANVEIPRWIGDPAFSSIMRNGYRLHYNIVKRKNGAFDS